MLCAIHTLLARSHVFIVAGHQSIMTTQFCCTSVSTLFVQLQLFWDWALSLLIVELICESKCIKGVYLLGARVEKYTSTLILFIHVCINVHVHDTYFVQNTTVVNWLLQPHKLHRFSWKCCVYVVCYIYMYAKSR